MATINLINGAGLVEEDWVREQFGSALYVRANDDADTTAKASAKPETVVDRLRRLFGMPGSQEDGA